MAEGGINDNERLSDMVKIFDGNFCLMPSPTKDSPDGRWLHKDHRHVPAIFEQMNRRRETGQYCDVTLVVGEDPPEEIHAHKLVLSSYSRYLLSARFRAHLFVCVRTRLGHIGSLNKMHPLE